MRGKIILVERQCRLRCRENRLEIEDEDGSRGLAAENARVARFTPRSVAVRLLELSVGNFDAMTNLNCDACPFVPLDEVICI